MAHQRTTSSSHWTSTQGYVFGVICLLLGIAVGFIVRGTMDHSGGGSAPAASSSPAATAAGTASIPGMGGMNDVTSQQLAEMGRKKAAHCLDVRRVKTNGLQEIAIFRILQFDQFDPLEKVDKVTLSFERNATPNAQRAFEQAPIKRVVPKTRNFHTNERYPRHLRAVHRFSKPAGRRAEVG